jgi:cephalosporin hydroxylase
VRITIDSDTNKLEIDSNGSSRTLDLYSTEAFEILSDLWLKTSWNQKYSYTFTWLGRPIIQHPEDLVRFQEVVCDLKPDIIVETGVAHGGSLVLSASLMKAMGVGRKVIGVDIEIRAHNRAAIEAHTLAPMIALIEGDSVSRETIAQVERHLRPNDKVLVVLDSNHSRSHVLAELEAYSHLVTPGSYVVATDGVMESVFDVPRGVPAWRQDNPAQAARDFVLMHPDFEIREPAWKFNESSVRRSITAWPNAWIRRTR